MINETVGVIRPATPAEKKAFLDKLAHQAGHRKTQSQITKLSALIKVEANPDRKSELEQAHAALLAAYENDLADARQFAENLTTRTFQKVERQETSNEKEQNEKDLAEQQARDQARENDRLERLSLAKTAASACGLSLENYARLHRLDDLGQE